MRYLLSLQQLDGTHEKRNYEQQAISSYSLTLCISTTSIAVC